MREIDGEQYKTLKSGIEAEITRLERSQAIITEQTAQTRTIRESDAKAHEIARAALREGRLSQELVDLLIETVLVYPGKKVEVGWKVSDFINQSTHTMP